jgi:hypothetical protein
MNTSRATVGIAVTFLAAVLSLAAAPHGHRPGAAAFTGDASVPPASEVFARGETGNAPQGNVEDMAY